jgi:predicted AAA+ superfamily ATPase
VPTVGDWLHVLEITGQVILVPPYFESFGKRLIKSPKVYLGDSGLACYLLGIATQAELDRSPFLGALFEGYVAAEILKSQVNQGRRKELHHFRDQQGLEVDFLFPNGQSGLWMVECKASKTVHPSMAGPLASLRRSMSDRAPVRLSVVHRASTTAPPTRALAPGVEALDVRAFVDDLNARPGRSRKAAVRRPRKAK